MAEIDQLQDLTEQMLLHALTGEWEDLMACETKRTAIIKSITALTADDNTRNKLADMIDKNAQILTLAMTEKDKIADEMRQSKKLEKAEQAYRQY